MRQEPGQRAVRRPSQCRLVAAARRQGTEYLHLPPQRTSHLREPWPPYSYPVPARGGQTSANAIMGRKISPGSSISREVEPQTQLAPTTSPPPPCKTEPTPAPLHTQFPALPIPPLHLNRNILLLFYPSSLRTDPSPRYSDELLLIALEPSPTSKPSSPQPAARGETSISTPSSPFSCPHTTCPSRAWIYTRRRASPPSTSPFGDW